MFITHSLKNKPILHYSKNAIFIFFIMLSVHVKSQSSKDSLFSIWKNIKLEDSVRANAYNILILSKYVNTKNDSAYIFAKELQQFAIDKKLKRQEANALNTLANIQVSIGEYNNATTNYFACLDIYKAINYKTGEANTLNNIGRMYKQNYNLDKALEYYNKSLLMSEELNDIKNLSTVYTNIGNVYSFRFKLEKASEYYFKSLEMSQSINDLEGEAITLINIGQNYDKQKNYKKAIEYINKGYEIGKQIDNINIQMNSLNMLSVYYLNQNNAKMAIKHAKIGLAIAEKIENPQMQEFFYYTIYDGYKLSNKPSIALEYLEKSINIEGIVNKLKNTKLLQKYEISTAHIKDSLLQAQNELKIKLDHQLEIQQKNKEKTNLTIAWGSSLSLVSIFAFIIFKNTKRKQRKAEKERQDQIEEKEKILKDLELTTIDAMIKGQEKERQRLAADLHDSVGATLSAAKLQFEYLINNQTDIKVSEELIKKTSTLLEDAYVEIRSMAHLKNSGVMAKNGLLPAIEKLSTNASGINGLTFEVTSFGLENRLENSLEISIFRIIQELITNIIKHANATKGIVHLTNHDESLNILVEDNGKGFNTKKMKKSSGMGIHSIDKRVEHLEGTITIESKKNRGTTVIIDIPL